MALAVAVMLHSHKIFLSGTQSYVSPDKKGLAWVVCGSKGANTRYAA